MIFNFINIQHMQLHLECVHFTHKNVVIAVKLSVIQTIYATK